MHILSGLDMKKEAYKCLPSFSLKPWEGAATAITASQFHDCIFSLHLTLFIFFFIID